MKDKIQKTKLKVIVLAQNSWQGQWVNRQQLLSRLGTRHTIVYSTGGWFTWDRNSPEWCSASLFGEFKLLDNVWVDESPQYLLLCPKLPLFDQTVMRLLCRRWKSWLDKQGEDGPLIAHVFHPMFYSYLKHLKPDFILYHAYDLYRHTPG